MPVAVNNPKTPGRVTAVCRAVGKYGLVLGVILYTGVLLAAGAYTRFHVGHDDFWANCYLASAADLSRPGTLYNGFFPFGYTLATLCAADDGCVMLGLRDGRVHRLK